MVFKIIGMACIAILLSLGVTWALENIRLKVAEKNDTKGEKQ